MTIGDLALLLVLGLAGPLLASNKWIMLPAVVGEILAGVMAGHTGFRWIDTSDPTLEFLSSVGFALLMFHVGMRVPLRNEGLRDALGRGAVAALVAAALAVPAALLAASVAGGPARVYAVVLASSSAAVVLPMLQERGLKDGAALIVMAQVTVADIFGTLALAFALRPHKALEAAIGSALVAASVLVLLLVARRLEGSKWVDELVDESRERGWALRLRVSLIVLFGLTWMATKSGSSGLIAGFGAGLMVASFGGRRRLDMEVLGVGEGLLVPLFFVVLGAKLDLRALVNQPKLLALAGVLLVVNAIVHVAAALLTRQRAGSGLMATAQLGVPAAAVAIGLPAGVLTPGQATALIAAAMGTIGLALAGTALLAGPSART